MYKILKKSKKSCARLGIFKTKSGEIHTPVFMPIATRGVIKSLSYKDIEKLSPEIILGNTYHLYLKPGLDVIKKFGSVGNFMNFKKSILTDSGGFQVFSLSKIRKLKKDGVEFQSTYDGSKHFFTPASVMKTQSMLDSDIQMVLDVCMDSKSDKRKLEQALEITSLWAGMCKKAKKKFDPKNKNLLFAIVQGGLNKELRSRSLRELVKIGFDGYAIGGLAVGETNEEMYEVLSHITKEMPEKNPRYLMGVGYPENIITAIKNGVDMFDCVIPSREARHGRMYFFKGDNLSKDFYKTINITNAKFAKDYSLINKDSKIDELKIYSKAYLHHLFKVQDSLALRLSTLNNIEFYLEMMKKVRILIKAGKF